MKLVKKILISVIFLVGLLLLWQVKAKASYSIEKMDIKATVLDNGDVHIKQSITYKFNGNYNGIYINVPYEIYDLEKNEIIAQNRINDNLYTSKAMVVNSIADSNGIIYTKKESAYKGNKGVYTVENKNGICYVKVYSPSVNETKVFSLDYTLQNLCVKHKDVGELYYNFIGGEWDVDIKNLNIDVCLPNNKGDIYIWGHGPLTGSSKIVSKKQANFKVDNVKKGQYVATRVMFDNSNIANSKKLSNINAEHIILSDERQIVQNKEVKNQFTRSILIFAGVLVIYWIILLLVFEKEKKYEVSCFNEEELFKKYNPLIAGCIQGSREILARDIIAVVLNLIEKKCIHLEIIPKMSNRLKEDQYSYVISKNEEQQTEMDTIERFVYNWIFGMSEKSIDLQTRLEQIPKDKEANERFKTLSNITRRELGSLGANEAKVPIYLRILNWGVFIIAILTIVRHILFNGFDIYTSDNALMIMGILPYFIIPIFILGYIPLSILIMVRHKVNNIVGKISGQRVVTTTISILLITAVVVILTVIFSPVKYIIVDELLLCIVLIIVLTDNLMLKNNDTIIEDYAKLNLLKDKMEYYTLLEEKDIEHIELYDKYLCYAVSFGIGEKMIKRLKNLHLDEDLEKLMQSSLMENYVYDDYYWFYCYASLDRRFLRSYGRGIRKCDF